MKIIRYVLTFDKVGMLAKRYDVSFGYYNYLRHSFPYYIPLKYIIRSSVRYFRDKIKN